MLPRLFHHADLSPSAAVLDISHVPVSLNASDPVSRATIIATTVLLGVGGACLIFAPVEIASALQLAQPTDVATLLQLYGAALFGLAMSGWMVKDSVVGGVFGRSYVAGNAAHAITGLLILVRPALSDAATPTLWLLTAVYLLLAVIFAYLMFFAAPGAHRNA